jgi:hypothetical protein
MTNNLPTNWQELQAAIEQWGTDRNFYGEDGATYTGQWMKLVEGFGELVLGLNKNKPKLIKDALGDMVVVLVHMAKLTKTSTFNLSIETLYAASNYFGVHTQVYYLLGYINKSLQPENICFRRILEVLINLAKKELDLPLFDCVLASYIEIKDRKGKMIDGKFVK